MSKKVLTRRQLKMLFRISDGECEQAYDWDNYEQDRERLISLGLVHAAKNSGWWTTQKGINYLERCCFIDADCNSGTCESKEHTVTELDELVTKEELQRVQIALEERIGAVEDDDLGTPKMREQIALLQEQITKLESQPCFEAICDSVVGVVLERLSHSKVEAPPSPQPIKEWTYTVSQQERDQLVVMARELLKALSLLS